MRNARRNRKYHGCPMLYQCLAQFYLRGEYVQRVISQLTHCWPRIEVPRYFCLKLLPKFIYKALELRDAGSD